MNQVKELLAISDRKIRYYNKIGFLKTKRKERGNYIFSERDINFLTFIGDPRYAGLCLSEIKKIHGIQKISGIKNRRTLLEAYESLEEYPKN